ncbi:hypothetical protein BS50DRAFT_244166 [Corynespora cassiicola Philippines]|uniref:Uncharacterized protein n=1 Tax=Corynespora cassiicola Philippines TaxID=1448308 RepID=A0A2T2P3B3_CORCC|nr:hypothetical protein BS50DRAFT_244166 [Corynespora cassiicola Philippines]
MQVGGHRHLRWWRGTWWVAGAGAGAMHSLIARRPRPYGHARVCVVDEAQRQSTRREKGITSRASMYIATHTQTRVDGQWWNGWAQGTSLYQTKKKPPIREPAPKGTKKKQEPCTRTHARTLCAKQAPSPPKIQPPHSLRKAANQRVAFHARLPIHLP